MKKEDIEQLLEESKDWGHKVLELIDQKQSPIVHCIAIMGLYESIKKTVPDQWAIAEIIFKISEGRHHQ